MPSSAQALPEHIQWHEGMLLLPQHFQQFDIRAQQVLQYHLQSLNPLYWGVESLTFNQALLTSGTCRLLSFRGIMPDGTFIDDLPSSSSYLEADLSTLATNFQAGPLTVYLCVPELKGDSTDILGQRPRFRSVSGRSVTDMNTGESPVVIPRLELKLELIVSATPPAKYISMPIARIQYDGKIYTFDTYQPPILSVTQDTLFWTICDTIASQVREKLGYVQQKLQSIEQNPNLLTAQQALSIIRIQLLSSLLAFEALQQVGSVHPFLLYCGLCTIAGTVSGISRTSLPPSLQPIITMMPLQILWKPWITLKKYSRMFRKAIQFFPLPRQIVSSACNSTLTGSLIVFISVLEFPRVSLMNKSLTGLIML